MTVRILDLYCGAGGASAGYQTAVPAAHIVGVDIAPQPDYPFEFVKCDVLQLEPAWVGTFDLVHASPPCQAYSTMGNRHRGDWPDLIGPTRDLLTASQRDYVIENVLGARRLMRNVTMLTGAQFALPVRRPRLFETTFPVTVPQSQPNHRTTLGIYGKPDGRRLWTRRDGSILHAWQSIEQGQRALEVPWITSARAIAEAIPPRYTAHLGAEWLRAERRS